ncbi:MAG: ribosome-associated translation inhibitor RaiA [Candidatus Paceibacterota bacterium]
MQIHLQGKNIELTDDIKNYVSKRVTNLEKLLSRIEEGEGEVRVNFEVARTTNHHKAGDIFHADCLINIDGKEFYASADKDDLLACVDEVKDALYHEINKNKDRRQTLYKRGASSVKKMLKGLSKRNPFTSKY